MKKILMMAVATILTLPALTAQQKALNFRKLQEFLPSIAVPNFKRHRPTGSTETTMGMATSKASVRYTEFKVLKAGDVEVKEQQMTIGDTLETGSIEIEISDITAMPMMAMAYSMQGDFDRDTDDGYEKSILYKNKYRGKEEARTESSSKSCELEVAIGTRFIIKLEYDTSDNVKTLYRFLDAIDLDKLEVATQ